MSTVLQLVRTLSSRPVAELPAGVSVRNFSGSEDIVAWLKLRQQAFARQTVGVRAWDETDFAAEFLRKPWWNPRRMWIAEPTNDLPPVERSFIGAVTCAVRGVGPAAQPAVHWLVVHPRWRNRGVGRLLLNTLEAACWDSGQRTIVLETHIGWAAAVRLYQSLGYRTVGD